MQGGGLPEECDAILQQCYPPPPDDCMGQYAECLDQGIDPVVCEEKLQYCSNPDPQPDPDVPASHNDFFPLLCLRHRLG